MSRKITIILSVVAVAALCLSAVSLCFALRPDAQEPDAQEPSDIQYVMYLGTNDKDTNEPVMDREDAKAKAEEILLEHFGGYTIQEANGGWIDEEIVYKEYTLVIYLSDTTIADVHAAADEMIRVFRQSSVLIQANKTTTEFYAGEN